MSGIQVDIDALRNVAKQIDEIDTVLDANSGSKNAGKRAVKNSLINTGDSNFATQVVSQLRGNFDGEDLIGTYLALQNALDVEFSDEADEVIDAKVQENVSNVESVSDEEVMRLSEERKEKVSQFKALKSILETFGEDVSSVSDPKIRRGGAGPRGPRTLSKFQYTVNETELEPAVNKLSTVAKLCGNIKVKELKDHIESQGVDLKNPPAEWQASLPNDVGTLYATALPEFEDDFTESDEDSDDE